MESHKLLSVVTHHDTFVILFYKDTISSLFPLVLKMIFNSNVRYNGNVRKLSLSFNFFLTFFFFSEIDGLTRGDVCLHVC